MQIKRFFSRLILISVLTAITFSCSKDDAKENNNDVKPIENLTQSFTLDFEDGDKDEEYAKHNWLNIATVGSEKFEIGSYKARYLQIRGYESGSKDIEAYFISPVLTLNHKGKKKTFNFMIERDYSKDETLELLISTKLNTENPEKSEWKALEFNMPEKEDFFGKMKFSGDIDLSNYEKEIRIAFRYRGNNSDKSGTFRLDDIKFVQETTNNTDNGDNNNGENVDNTSGGSYYRTISTKKPTWGTYGIPSQPTWGFVKPDYKKGFYSSLNGLKGDALKAQVKKLTQVTTSRTSYERERYTATDEDPRNTNNIILIYRGTSVAKSSTNSWNREHVFACSNGGFKRGSNGGGADNHHIRCSNPSENSSRGNKKLGSGYTPRAAVRGDVARMTFYVALMYNIDPSRNINLSWALKMNTEDKVDDWEMKINNVVEDNQGNRNPFIDHPELVDYIYGSKKNEVFKLN